MPCVRAVGRDAHALARRSRGRGVHFSGASASWRRLTGIGRPDLHPQPKEAACGRRPQAAKGAAEQRPASTFGARAQDAPSSAQRASACETHRPGVSRTRPGGVKMVWQLPQGREAGMRWFRCRPAGCLCRTALNSGWARRPPGRVGRGSPLWARAREPCAGGVITKSG
jgi:hypothetical protein